MTPPWVRKAREGLLEAQELENQGLRERTRQVGLNQRTNRDVAEGQLGVQQRRIGLAERLGGEEMARSQQGREIAGAQAAQQQALGGLEFQDKQKELKLKELKLDVVLFFFIFSTIAIPKYCAAYLIHLLEQ